VAWLGCTEPPAELNALSLALRKEVSPVIPDCPHDEFHPHITVARDCLTFPSPRSVPVVKWPVEDFVLIDSTRTPGGPVYRVLRHWQLEP
jgi:2'-5' RNA ligase